MPPSVKLREEWDWEPLLSKPCLIHVTSMAGHGLRNVARYGGTQSPVVKATLLPWNITCESTWVKHGGSDPEWSTRDDNNTLALEFPGCMGENREADLLIEIYHRKRLGRDALVGEFRVPMTRLFYMFSKANPILQSKFKLENDRGFFTADLWAMPTGHELDQLEADRLSGRSSIRVVEMSNLMSKLTGMFENACVNILCNKPFSSAFSLCDRKKDGTVSKQDFIKTLNSLEFKLTVQEFSVLMNMVEIVNNNRVVYGDLERLINEHEIRQEYQNNNNNHPTSSYKNPVAVDSDEEAKDKLRDILKKAQHRGVSVSQAFSHFDKRGTGCITKGEFQQGLKQLGIKLSVKQLVILLNELDKDRDGQISLVEFLQFAELDRNQQYENKKPAAVDKDKPKKQEQRIIVNTKCVSPTLRRQEKPYDKAASDSGKVRQLQDMLDKCRERISALETRCAEAEANNHIVVSRAARNARHKERRRLENSFINEIAKRIEQDFEAPVSQLRVSKEDHVNLEEQAHIAFETMLEEQMRELKQTVKIQKAQLAEEQRRGHKELIRARQLETFVYAKRELFNPTISSLGIRSSALARQLVTRSLSLNSFSTLDLFEGFKMEDTDEYLAGLPAIQQLLFPYPVSEDDLQCLEHDLVHLGWCEKLTCGRRIQYDMKELSKGLDKCKDWDMSHLLSNDSTLLGTVEREQTIPPQLLDLAVIAGQNGCDALNWFKSVHHPLGDAKTGLAFDDLNDELMLSHVPNFDSVKELEDALTWISKHCPSKIGKPLLEGWQSTGTVLSDLFAKAINAISDEIGVQKEHQDRALTLRFPEDRTEKSKQKESKSILIPTKESLFTNFSTTEHSSCWAPLARFGRVPYDCVRGLKDFTVMEHNTTRSRSVMAYVEGVIDKKLGKNSVFFRMEKGLDGQGSWALCVTSAPPSNRPVRGSAIYQHTGEAKIEGSNEIGQSALYLDLLDQWSISSRKKRERLRQLDRPEAFERKEETKMYELPLSIISVEALEAIRRQTQSDDHCLKSIYSKFIPERIAWEMIGDVCTLVDEKASKQDDGDLLEDDSLLLLEWKAREIEARIRMDFSKEISNAIDRDHWTLVEAFNKKSSDRSVISKTELIHTISDLFGDYKRMLRAKEWREILIPLLDIPDSSFSFKRYVDEIHDIQTRIRAAFYLTPDKIQEFQSLVNKLVESKRKYQHLHFKSVGFRDVIGAVVDANHTTVSFYVNGKFQTELAPSCRKPWRFAWYTTRDSAVSIVSDFDNSTLNKK